MEVFGSLCVEMLGETFGGFVHILWVSAKRRLAGEKIKPFGETLGVLGHFVAVSLLCRGFFPCCCLGRGEISMYFR